MVVGSGQGHYLEILAKKNPVALDYFPGDFTFKGIPRKGDFPEGEDRNHGLKG